MRFDLDFLNDRFVFWAPALTILGAGCWVASGLGIGQVFEETARPTAFMDDGEIQIIDNTTDYYARFLGNTLYIRDAETHNIVPDAHFISEDFETSGERLLDFITTGDPHIASALFRIGDGQIMRANVVGPELPPRLYYVQNGAVSEPAI
ncbi:MAG: hypothetical protein AAGB32_03390 [Pseudomonadota bacterium]